MVVGGSGDAVFVRDESTGLVHTERAVQFAADGRTVLGPGSGRLEAVLDR